MNRSILAFAFIVGLVTAADRSTLGQAPILLTQTSSKLLAVSPFTVAGSAQCDKRGNLYFYVGSAPNDSVIYKLLMDGTHNIFGLTGKEASDNYYVGFRVDYDGKLWLLAGDKNDNPNIFEFRDDATSPNVTKLEAPEDLKAPTIRNFITLQTGHILLHGYLKQATQKEGKQQSYVAEFDSSGKLLHKAIGKEDGDASDWLAQTPAIQGEDGLIYLLELSRVLVVSQTAKTVREIKLRPPESDYRPYEMYLSGQRLAVAFYKRAPSPSRLVTRYALLDASTGEQLRLYQPDSDLGNNLVCFSTEGFTFYRVEHGRIKLVTAAAN